jgi:DNA-binding transcriptional MerR regulator
MHENAPYVNVNVRQESAAARGFFRIGEVCRLTDTKPFVLRYWETEFPMLQPVKSPKGHRLYRHEDVETVRHIKHLLYDEGFTIAGARRHLSEGSGGAASSGYAAQAEDNFGSPAAPPDAPPDPDFRGSQVAGALALVPPESELPGTQELSGARLSNHSSGMNGATVAGINHAAADSPASDRGTADRPASERPTAERAISSRAASDRAALDHAAADRAASDRAAIDHAAVGRALVDRKVLLDLRDALRSLLTLLETE